MTAEAVTSPAAQGSATAGCWACGDARTGATWGAQERMFGWGDPFAYAECAACGSLRIADVPGDLARYYEHGYYSMAPRPTGGLARRIRRSRSRAALGHPAPVGRLLCRVVGRPWFADWLETAGAPSSGRVLDVGTGAGELVFDMADAGVRVEGIDPYAPADLDLPGGARVRRCDLAAATGSWDLLMLHHSLEHMPDPLAQLQHVRRLLAADGTALVRVPLADSWAARTYGTRWAQLDAPRHLWLPTVAGIRALAARAGLEVATVVHDSTAFGLWASELHEAGVPGDQHLAYAAEHGLAPSDRAALRRLTARAQELNEAGDGDQAAFYLRRA